MEYLIGLGLAILVCVFANLVGFDRERVFYPTVVIVNATYYILFAAMGGSASALLWESVITCIFATVAVVGYKKYAWLIVVGLVGHGVFDSVHHLFIRNPGMPVWWPGFCLSFDVLAGIFLLVLLMRRTKTQALPG